MYLFSLPYIRLKQRQFAFKYTFLHSSWQTCPFYRTIVPDFIFPVDIIPCPLLSASRHSIFHIIMVFKFLVAEIFSQSWKENQNRFALGRRCVKVVSRFVYSGNHTDVRHKLVLWRTLVDVLGSRDLEDETTAFHRSVCIYQTTRPDILKYFDLRHEHRRTSAIINISFLKGNEVHRLIEHSLLLLRYLIKVYK